MGKILLKSAGSRKIFAVHGNAFREGGGARQDSKSKRKRELRRLIIFPGNKFSFYIFKRVGEDKS